MYLLDSKSLFLYMFPTFSIMNMYFLNQTNKTCQHWRKLVSANMGLSFPA